MRLCFRRRLVPLESAEGRGMRENGNPCGMLLPLCHAWRFPSQRAEWRLVGLRYGLRPAGIVLFLPFVARIRGRHVHGAACWDYFVRPRFLSSSTAVRRPDQLCAWSRHYERWLFRAVWIRFWSAAVRRPICETRGHGAAGGSCCLLWRFNLRRSGGRP